MVEIFNWNSVCLTQKPAKNIPKPNSWTIYWPLLYGETKILFWGRFLRNLWIWGGFGFWIYLSLVQYFCSLLAFLLSFTPTHDVEALFDWLTSSCGTTLQTGEVEQARRWIFFHLSFGVATIYTSHIRIHILLVQGRDMLVLIATLKNKIRFGAKIAFNIQLSLEIVQNMLLFTPNLLANEVKVLPGGLRGGNKARLRQLILLVLALLFIPLFRIVHRCFNSIQQEFVLILLVSVHLIQVKFLYKTKKITSEISTFRSPLIQ